MPVYSLSLSLSRSPSLSLSLPSLSLAPPLSYSLSHSLSLFAIICMFIILQRFDTVPIFTSMLQYFLIWCFFVFLFLFVCLFFVFFVSGTEMISFYIHYHIILPVGFIWRHKAHVFNCPRHWYCLRRLCLGRHIKVDCFEISRRIQSYTDTSLKME